MTEEVKTEVLVLIAKEVVQNVVRVGERYDLTDDDEAIDALEAIVEEFHRATRTLELAGFKV